MFARGNRNGWFCWGNQAEDYYPEWETYKNHSQNGKEKGSQLINPYKNKLDAQLRLLDKKKKYG